MIQLKLANFLTGFVSTLAFAFTISEDTVSVHYDGMEEVSGVASDGEHYLVVGNRENNFILQIPDKEYRIETQLTDLESIEWVKLEDGQELFFLLSEEDKTLIELRDDNGILKVTKNYEFAGSEWNASEGRGLEGLAVKGPGANGNLEVAVLWEGGFAQVGGQKPPVNWDIKKPRLATFEWKPGGGVQGAVKTFEVQVPTPPASQADGKAQGFRATDLVWNGDALLMLLGSTSSNGKGPYDHTWLQNFCLSATSRTADPVSDEIVLYLAGNENNALKGKNWEALDWKEPEGKNLVFGYDAPNKGDGYIHLWEYPDTRNITCSQ